MEDKDAGETNEDEDGGSDTNWAAYAGLGASFAPFVGNMIEGATLKGAEPVTYDRVGRTYTPEFADERSRLNIVDESYGGLNEAIAGASSGNIGAYRSNVKGAYAKKNIARGSAWQEIAEINRGERKLENADIAAARAEDIKLTNLERKERQLDDTALTSAKSAYRASAYESLGEMGKSLFGVAQMSDMTSYGLDGGKKNTDESDKGDDTEKAGSVVTKETPAPGYIPENSSLQELESLLVLGTPSQQAEARRRIAVLQEYNR